METEPGAHRSAAITGAGGGLGRAVALGLAQKGYRVYGSARKHADVAEVAAASAGTVQMDICDVTNEASVTDWARKVSAALGPDGLDILVSNAGILTVGPLETLTREVVRHAFEVNVFGSLDVINAFLPALRAAHGRVVQVGSMTGSFPLPFVGPACASKAALESFAAVYRAELKPFGVDFVMARPGNMRTGGPAKAIVDFQEVADSMTPEQRALYGAEFDVTATTINEMQDSGLAAERAAEYVIDAAERTPAPIAVAVGPEADQILQLIGKKTAGELDILRREFVGLPA
jgi:NAD(P)-dependent dehydrogenase (short-subunit alcohol dehydrogenase family)